MSYYLVANDTLWVNDKFDSSVTQEIMKLNSHFLPAYASMLLPFNE